MCEDVRVDVFDEPAVGRRLELPGLHVPKLAHEAAVMRDDGGGVMNGGVVVPIVCSRMHQGAEVVWRLCGEADLIAVAPKDLARRITGLVVIGLCGLLLSDF